VSWTHQIEELATSALVLARSRAGRIAAVTVGVPPGTSPELVVQHLRERLATYGYPALEVSTLSSPGPLRILTAEFER
jgi:hypothetical protein